MGVNSVKEAADMATAWMPQINRAACIGCGDCVALCPTGALGLQDGKAAVIRPDLCTYCGVCEDVCPAGAIELPYLITKSIHSEEISEEKSEETKND